MRIRESSRMRSLVLGSSIVLTLGIYDAPKVQEPCKDQRRKDFKASKIDQKDASPSLNCVTLVESSSPCAQMSTCAKSSDSNAKGPEQKVEHFQVSELPVWALGLLELLRILVSWPVVLTLLILYLALSRFAPYKLARILKPFRSLKLFGTEFVLSEEVGTDAEQAIEIYRKKVKRQFDTLAETYDIRAKLEDVIDQVRKVIDRRKPIKDLRVTLHVPAVRRHLVSTRGLLPSWGRSRPYVLFTIWYHRSVLESARKPDPRSSPHRLARSGAPMGNDTRGGGGIGWRTAVFPGVASAG